MLPGPLGAAGAESPARRELRRASPAAWVDGDGSRSDTMGGRRPAKRGGATDFGRRWRPIGRDSTLVPLAGLLSVRH
jgi:hypothetical protein